MIEVSLSKAVENLEKEAKKHGATHLFAIRYKTLPPSERPYRPIGQYEAIADAYGPITQV